MRRLLCMIAAFMLFAVSLTALAGGLLPPADTLFAVEMPSMSAIVLRDADQVTEGKDGSIAYVYRNIDHDTFDAFSERLSDMGCELGNYTVKDDTLTAMVTKGAGSMMIVYINSSLTCMVAYHPGSCPETVPVIAKDTVHHSYTVGDTVVFGAYEQDNDESNGKEPIEWIVLDVNEKGECLLISKYVIDTWSAPDGSTWGNSSLRSWLNGEFYEAAFTDTEKARILETALTSDSLPGYGDAPDIGTVDKVFLLNVTEAEQYFEQASDRVCYSYTDREEPANWRLRTTDCCIDEEGTAVHTAGEKKYDPIYDVYVYIYFQAGVRPAVWILPE